MLNTSDFINRAALCIGADPEFFVKKGDTFVSGHAFPCGSKTAPRKTAHGAVQNDGVALEVNVPEAFSKAGFILNFRGVVHDLAQIVHNWDKGEAYIVAEPVATFTEEYMKGLPPVAKDLGCNPDFNAYTMDVTPTPNSAVQFRTGAGHLHLGWTEDAEGMEHFQKCATLVKQLDFTVGLRTLLFDTDGRRRSLYGKAGAFRHKPYGVEYRVPSNAWCQSEDLAAMMFDGCTQAVEMLNDGIELDKTYPGLAQKLIDDNKTAWVEEYPKLADVLGLGDK